MAIEKIASGGYQDQVLIKGTNSVESISEFVKNDEAGGTDDYNDHLIGGYQAMVLTSGGEIMSIIEYVKYLDGGGLDTITGQLVGGGANIIVDGGVMQSLVEKHSGNIQVLEETPAITLLETSDEDIPDQEEVPE